jgi:serine/threonine-protein kinase
MAGPMTAPTDPVAPLSRAAGAGAAPALTEPGSAIGPYRVVRLLGRGAAGAVHLAIDERSRKAVALKTLNLGAEFDAGDFAEARTRFLDEARVAQSLIHPDIVKVYAADEHQGIAWMAMQLLPGCTLQRYTHASRLLPERLALQVSERLARAAAFAHAQGVVHRDIKPGNVMLDLPTRSLKLTDFGIAGLTDMSRTRTGVVLGTPLYMAPEQLAGAAADARGDVYSLGVLTFQLLSGRLPHEASSLGELLRQVAREAAPDLSRLRPGVAPQIAAVVARALHKQPALRLSGASHMADQLALAAAYATGDGAR